MGSNPILSAVTDHQRGFLLTSLGVAVIIPDATLVRLIEAPSLTNAVWRTGLSAVALGVFVAVHRRSRLTETLRSLGPWGAASSGLWGIGTISFVVAVNNTAVANVVLLLALSPMWAVGFTRLLLGVPIPPRTLVAIPFALVGVAIAVGGSLDAGVRSGEMLALIASLGMAGNLTIVRAHSHIDMVPAAAIGNVAGFVVLAGIGTSPAIESGDLPALLLLGLVVVPGALGLIAAGARYLSSPETTLLLLGETVLSPVLAALVIDEAIRAPAYVGGAIVVTTLAVHAGVGLHRDWKSRPNHLGFTDH